MCGFACLYKIGAKQQLLQDADRKKVENEVEKFLNGHFKNKKDGFC
jgi:hypothetical protein